MTKKQISEAILDTVYGEDAFARDPFYSTDVRLMCKIPKCILTCALEFISKPEHSKFNINVFNGYFYFIDPETYEKHYFGCYKSIHGFDYVNDYIIDY